jgi:hypothetical protein
MGDDTVQKELSLLRKEAQEAHRELMLARANYVDLLNSVWKTGQRINELYNKLAEIFNGKG